MSTSRPASPVRAALHVTATVLPSPVTWKAVPDPLVMLLPGPIMLSVPPPLARTPGPEAVLMTKPLLKLIVAAVLPETTKPANAPGDSVLAVRPGESVAARVRDTHPRDVHSSRRRNAGAGRIGDRRIRPAGCHHRVAGHHETDRLAVELLAGLEFDAPAVTAAALVDE